MPVVFEQVCFELSAEFRVWVCKPEWWSVEDCSMLRVQRRKMRDRRACSSCPHYDGSALVVADRRRLLLELMLTICTRSQRYVGQSWWSIRCIVVAILKVIRWWTGSQWSFFRAGVMWALRSKPRTRRAAVFWTRCRGAIVDVWRLMSTELQLSMHCRTSDITRCNITFWVTELRSWNNRRRW